MNPQYAEQVRKTRVNNPAREVRMWSLQWWVRQIIYAAIVLSFVALMGLAEGAGR